MIPVVVRTARMDRLLSIRPKARLKIRTLTSVVSRVKCTIVHSALFAISCVSSFKCRLDMAMEATHRSTPKITPIHVRA